MITSTRHPLVRTFRRIGEHPHRDPQSRLLLDGPRLIAEALDAGIIVETVLVGSGPPADRYKALVARLRDMGARVHEAAPQVVQAASAVVTSPGIVAVAKRPAPGDVAVLARSDLVLLVADGIGDPGNFGTMVRTAVASGATAVASTGASVDPLAPKVLRATVGAAFKIPILRIAQAELRALLAARAVRVLVADAHALLDYTDAPLSPPVAIVIGSETSGPDPAWRATGTGVRIPLFGPVESLNAAIAAALLLYEVARRGT
ncbi:MAG: TrmH family RNA methyltransferase [Armatimonadota bacterium]